MRCNTNLCQLPRYLNSCRNWRYFIPCDLEIWWMTLKNNSAPLLCCLKLCASFHSHWGIQTGVTVRTHPIWVKVDDFFSRVTLKFDGLPLKTIGHLFNILHEALCIISKPLVNSNWSYSPETLNLGQNRQFFVPVDLEIWRMTLKNNRAPLLCCIKLCASFHSHLWIPTGVIVRKRPIWVKIDDFLVMWPWNLTDDLEKQ